MADIYTEHDGMIAVNLDSGEVESADEFYSGNRVTKEGYFHVTATNPQFGKPVMDQEEAGNKLPRVEVEIMVLDGTSLEDGKRLEDQIYKVINHTLYLANWDSKEEGTTKPLDEKKQKGIRAFAYAFGLISEADLGTKNVSIPFHMIDGRQAVVKVQREKDWTDKKDVVHKGGLKISWNNDAWPVDHERVKDVHKNREALSLLVGAGVGGSASDDDLADV